MGKYMRKGKGAGKVAVMEVSQGAMGVRTRAKTLALEQDRKLALARNASLKQQQQQRQTACGEPLSTCYLELRSRKLEKVVRDVEKPPRGSTRHESFVESGREVEEPIVNLDAACRTRPAAPILRIYTQEDIHGEVVCSSRTPDLSPKCVEDLDVPRDFPIEPEVSTPRVTEAAQLRGFQTGADEASLRPAQLRGLQPGADEAALRSATVPSRISDACKVTGEPGNSSIRKRNFRGSPVSSSSQDREIGEDNPGSSTRLDERQAHCRPKHPRIVNRAYMQTNLFNDAQAIDELFAPSEAAAREDGKRFTERYNFDVVNDKPLEGRYEWVAGEPRATTITPVNYDSATQQQQQDASD